MALIDDEIHRLAWADPDGSWMFGVQGDTQDVV
jgi:hypothetical protein